MGATPKNLTRDEWIKLTLGSGLLFGIILRITPGLMAGFPLNDGGMFLIMIQDIRASQYHLPFTTSYNLHQIPYAYPPLGFYLARFASDWFGVAEIDLLRWLPAFFSILSIFVFYKLAEVVIKDRPRSALATAILAVTTGGYFWQIMGGGLTRSLGVLLLLLSAYTVLKLFERGTRQAFFWAIAACTLVVLSHPEMALHAAGSCALIWVFYGRNRTSTVQALIVAVSTLLLTSPWWLSVVLRFGFAPFLSTLHTGMYGTPFGKALSNIVFARLNVVPFLLVLRLLGIGWSVWKRQFFLVAWVVLPVLVEPRSSPAISMIPLSMLAAIGLADAVPYLINLFLGKLSKPALGEFTQSKVFNLAIMSVVFYLFLESLISNFALVNTTLKQSTLSAMEWVRVNTPVDSQFVILTGGGTMTDPVQEWFPAIAKRRSQTTLQGLEWTLGPSFFPRHNQLVDLQACRDLACVEDWLSMTETPYTHLLIRTETLGDELPEAIQMSGRYKIIYQAGGMVIYEAVEK